MNRLKISQNNIELQEEVKFISLNGNEFEAFLHPAKIINSDFVNVEFQGLDFNVEWDEIFKNNNSQKKMLVKSDGYCSYDAYGEIISINPTIADFGDLKMEIDLSTNDAKVIGEFIYWKISRLDVFEISSA